MTRASVLIEQHGIPAVALVAAGFDRLAHTVAASLGRPDLALAIYPGSVPTDSPSEFRARVDGPVTDGVVDGLTRVPVETTARIADGPAPDEAAIVFTGTLDEVEEAFLERGWSDGLPVIPPTVERVARFLDATHRDPTEVLGVFPPAQRAATIHTVAVNGVVAGCRPEYQPVLVAIVEAVAAPEFRVEDAGATPGWEPLVTLSGAVVDALGFNAGTGVLRVGHQANTSVGRFVRLMLRNVAGQRIGRDETDQAGVGATFHVVLAEDDAALARLGWQPHRVEQGFGPIDSTVTVQSVVTVSQPINSEGDTAAEHLDQIADVLATILGPRFLPGLTGGRLHPIVVMTEAIARVMARDGLSKADVQRELDRRLRIPAAWIEQAEVHRLWNLGRTAIEPVDHDGIRRIDLAALVAAGTLPATFAESDDPERRVPMLVRPEFTSIVVAGNPNRNQSRCYLNNHVQGVPVTRLVAG